MTFSKKFAPIEEIPFYVRLTSFKVPFLPKASQKASIPTSPIEQLIILSFQRELVFDNHLVK